jgi:hypothetical protein
VHSFILVLNLQKKRMNTVIWEKWNHDWNWIQNIAQKRNWHIIDQLSIQPPIEKNEIYKIAQSLEIKLPDDFIEIVTKYSSGVNFFFQIEGQKPEGQFKQLSSVGYEQIWSIKDLWYLKESYDNWVKVCFKDPNDDYNKIWHNKTPIISVATGDLIAFDTSVTGNEYPVVFLSHDGSDFHGKRLGYNFIDFITRWSNIGCFGPEDWQFEPFYDPLENILLLEGEKVSSWKKWLDNY